MASKSEEERLKAEIAKLSGAIQTHKQQHHQPSYPSNGHASSQSRGPYPASSTSYRGWVAVSGRGRGRVRRAATIPPRNRTLVLNDSNSTPAASTRHDTAGENSATAKAPDTAMGATTTPASASGASEDGWIKRKSTHNLSLVSSSTFARTEPARLAALEATRKAKATASSSASSLKKTKSTKPSSSVRRGDNMGEVVIDGVVFEFDPSGSKLVKKAVQPSSFSSLSEAHASTSADKAPSAVPLKTSINGEEYIRTKRGNLISTNVLAKRKAQREAAAKMGRLDKMVSQISSIQATRNAFSSARNKTGLRTLDTRKAKTLCTFFQKTGACKRGLSCPYLHDSSKIALCPKVLRPSGCTLPKGTCALSHTLRPERVPHCVHYLRSCKCRNGEECMYTHSDKVEGGMSGKICRDFSEYGWCEKGKECKERHTYECLDFVEKGKCDRKGCKLVHVIRATGAVANGGGAGKNEVAQDDGEGKMMRDGELFIRDDAAAAEPSEDDADNISKQNKRKRPLIETELDDDDGQVLPSDHDDDENEDEQVTFTNHNESKGTKRRKAKAFTQQRDFISFDDDDAEEEDDQDDAEDDFSIVEQTDEEDEEGDDDEVASVHSEDFEVSDIDNNGEHSEAEKDSKEGDQDVENDVEEEEIEQDEEGTASPDVKSHVEGHRQAAHGIEDDDDDDNLVDRDL
ncbi:uncharacterized protein MEPE_06132 [Melanopsichium pennsylvanicum]|uniref:C3H1-type domain-containing protein n=2 Tax=Melanopsichium pennsylvanicum TaxID=63383 RepID=A0AAJ5C7Y2_9BASI|nr:ccch zinc finger protein [Melanopsichium pennsylvanicum 4]SNX87422.1 uncharacterized protein MEPE_06132 [Melanopsichium pennsylvanicum]